MFVWNRSSAVFESEEAAFLPDGVVLPELADFASREADLIVEVAHPDITKTWGEQFMRKANFLVRQRSLSHTHSVVTADGLSNSHGGLGNREHGQERRRRAQRVW